MRSTSDPVVTVKDLHPEADNGFVLFCEVVAGALT
jgi:hypothetical protein